MALQYLFFWNLKPPSDNQWRPQPSNSEARYISNLPSFLGRTDLEAAIVDTAPSVAGSGGLAHISQISTFGFTAHASIFRNAKTLTAMHRTTAFLLPVILACQAAGLEYRYLIPRWCHDRELRRDEVQVRQHVGVGMLIGGGIWTSRMIFKLELDTGLLLT